MNKYIFTLTDTKDAISIRGHTCYAMPVFHLAHADHYRGAVDDPDPRFCVVTWFGLKKNAIRIVREQYSTRRI